MNINKRAETNNTK